MTILLLAVGVTIDFGLTFLYSLIYEANDGIIGPSFLMHLFGGEDGWTRVAYFEWFRNSVLITFVIAIENVILSVINIKKS